MVMAVVMGLICQHIFCQLKGEFDDSLKWPVTIQFDLTLRNNTCRGNWYNINQTYVEILKKQAVAIGQPLVISETFVSHSKMFQYYICYDCLFFSVTNVHLR